jgi:uracil-DNA glycosylase
MLIAFKPILPPTAIGPPLLALVQTLPTGPGKLSLMRSARSAAEVATQSNVRSLAELDARISICRACPRLVAWREQVATDKRRAFADQTYWGRPVPGFGPADARILVVGLAPAAHGANRTGRMFTGDRSGDWLYASLHRVGLASQPTSVSADDGLALFGVRITAPVHCAPPANKPTIAERDTCRSWLVREVQLLWPSLRVVVVLGAFGWASLWASLRLAGLPVPLRVPQFAHGAEAELDGRTVLGCYHVSQQNTFTGRLTEPMLDAVFSRAAQLADLP